MQLSKRDMIGMEVLTSMIQSKHFIENKMVADTEKLIDHAISITDKFIEKMFNPTDGFKLIKDDGSVIDIDPVTRSKCASLISEGTYPEALKLLQDRHSVTEEEAECFLNMQCN